MYFHRIHTKNTKNSQAIFTKLISINMFNQFSLTLYRNGTRKKQTKIMIVISSREFRDNQKKYFDLIDQNEQVIVQRGKNQSYKLIAVQREETLLTEAEFYAKINHALQESEQGKITEIKSSEDFKTLLGL